MMQEFTVIVYYFIIIEPNPTKFTSHGRLISAVPWHD